MMMVCCSIFKNSDNRSLYIFAVASVRFDRPLYQVNEGDGQATVNVVLSRQSDVPVMLAFSTQPDTARGLFA